HADEELVSRITAPEGITVGVERDGGGRRRRRIGGATAAADQLQNRGLLEELHAVDGGARAEGQPHGAAERRQAGQGVVARRREEDDGRGGRVVRARVRGDGQDDQQC